MTPQELIELEHARQLPAWTMLKVRDYVVGWRSFSAHEICVLSELFESVNRTTEQDILDVGRILGLVVDEADND